jgi:hypothetical protein
MDTAVSLPVIAFELLPFPYAVMRMGRARIDIERKDTGSSAHWDGYEGSRISPPQVPHVRFLDHGLIDADVASLGVVSLGDRVAWDDRYPIARIRQRRLKRSWGDTRERNGNFPSRWIARDWKWVGALPEAFGVGRNLIVHYRPLAIEIA